MTGPTNGPTDGPISGLRGVSRASFGAAVDRLDALGDADLVLLAAELTEVVALLDREHRLRRALSDPARSAEHKAELVRSLLAGRVSDATADLVGVVAGHRWSASTDLPDALEHLAVLAEADQSGRDGTLDDLEDELFRFGRIVEGEPALRAALADRALPAERKREVVAALLEGKATPSTTRLVGRLVVRPRGRSLERGLATYSRWVAQRRSRLVAAVRTATPLTDAQRDRLAGALRRAYGRDVRLNIDIDPAVLGGLQVRVGDDLIDGSVAGRLEDLRRRLAG